MTGKTSEHKAYKLIEEAASKGLKELNLSSLHLTTIPPEIGQLTSLKSLNLSGNVNLASLPKEIGQLKALDRLNIDATKLTALPPEIGQLVNLKTLFAFNSSLLSLPAEIKFNSNLESIHMPGNLLASLPREIGRLSKLKALNLNFNKLSVLPAELGDLNNLITLNIRNNNLLDLPREITRLTNLLELDLRNNDLRIPLEILEKISKPQAIFSAYFGVAFRQGPTLPELTISVNLAANRRPIHEAKSLIVGQGSVGKSSLVQQILHGTFDQNQAKTEGISINQWVVDSESEIEKQKSEIKLNIWDFGGQEIMHATHQFFLTKRSLYLLVLDARLTQEENRVEYWLKIIQSFGGESPVLIVGNKTDQHPLDIDRTGLKNKYPNIVGILETSAATGNGIEELKAEITKQVDILPHVRDLLPETWFTVKSKLEELGRESNFITHNKYLELCAENEVSDETSQRTLIGFLHDLGVVLHFQDDPRLEALGILNPQWVTNGVYKILNSHTLFQNKGVLTTSMLDEILYLPEYPRGKRLFIVDMMKKFELCYDIEADKTFLVPDLLPKDEPAELKFNGVPAFEYAYPVLPSSVITRFIVRMNQKIDHNFVWRTGVVLKIGENLALVKADIEDRKITIAIDGLEHTRRDALSAIRYQLDEIHNSIKGLEPQKRVPIQEAPNAEPLDYDYLLQLERDGFDELPVKDGNRLVKVDVRKLLSGIESESQRKESAASITNIYVGGDVTGGNIISGNENQANISLAKAKKRRK